MKWLVALLGLFILLLLFQNGGVRVSTPGPSPESPVPSEANPRSVNTDFDSEPAPPVRMPENHSSDLADYEAQVFSLSSANPRLDQVRREVEKNPHNAPRSLIEFAKKLSPLMVSALEDPVKAEPMYRELERCALSRSQDIPESTQSLCMQNMKRLAERYPDQFEADFEKAMEEASEATTNFIQFMEN